LIDFFYTTDGDVIWQVSHENERLTKLIQIPFIQNIVMPLFPMSLNHAIAKYAFKFDELKVIFREVAFGMDYLHQNGYVHRDLTPANILVDFKQHPWSIKITDFGW
jgi:serine/threonine protein kinase